MRLTLFSSLAAALLFVASTASAQSGGRPQVSDAWKLLAERHDKDGDGKVTAEEYTRGVQAFARLDHNGDGVLTSDDFAGGRRRSGRGGPGGGVRGAGLAGRVIGRLADEDEDRSVSTTEWRNFIQGLDTQDGEIVIPGFDNPRLARFLDQDGNGKLETADLDALFALADADKSGALEESELGRSRGLGGRGGQGGRARRPGQDGERGPGGRRVQPGLPQPGDIAPDFILPYVGDSAKTAQLSSYAGEKPVALIFGSYT